MPAWASRWRRHRPPLRPGIRPVIPVTSMGQSVPMPPAGNGMPERSRIAVFGGIYSNYLALEAALGNARRRGMDAVYCLGDLGAFGPHPDRVFPLLHEFGV